MKRSNKKQKQKTVKKEEVRVILGLSPCAIQAARLTQWSNLLLKNINIDRVFVVGRTTKAGRGHK